MEKQVNIFFGIVFAMAVKTMKMKRKSSINQKLLKICKTAMSSKSTENGFIQELQNKTIFKMF